MRVWPRDYAVRDPAPSDGFEVIAPDGHVAATEGEPIRIGGG